MSVTDEDRQQAGQVAERAYLRGPKVLEREIAAALAEERERARAPFLALAKEFRTDHIEVALGGADYVIDRLLHAAEES